MRMSFLPVVLTLFFACAGNDASNIFVYEGSGEADGIYGRVNGLPGRKILLYQLYGDQVNLIDSAMAASDGTFQFKFQDERPRGLYRLAMGKSTLPGYHEGHRQTFDLVWDGTAVLFSTCYSSPVDSMEIHLSKENTLYYRLLQEIKEYDRKIDALSSALVSYPRGNSFYRRLERQYLRVQNRRSGFLDKIVKNNRGTVTASIARFYKMPVTENPLNGVSMDELKKNFFTEGQFADSVLLHTDLIPRKVIRYLSLYTGEPDDDEQQEEMIDAADIAMRHAMANEAVFYFVLEYLINGFDSMGMDRVSEYLTGRYLLGNVCFEEGVLLDQDMLSPAGNIEEGDRVPGFSFESLDGRMIDLEDIEADYTLILFWGSWCPHCKDIMDDLYEMYTDFRDSREGFLEVVAIGIEEDEKIWLDYIERGGYDWINYSSVQGWDCPVASAYNLVGTPTMILVDEDRRFVREPVRVRSLGRFLSRRM